MNLATAKINEQFLDKLGVDIISVEPLQGGANSQVAKVISGQKDTFFVKTYRQTIGDTRDRLGTEFEGLRFLWNHDIRSIPEPLFADRENNFAVYRFVQGQMLNSIDITTKHLSEIVAFFSALRDLIYAQEDAKKISKASEACFSLSDYLINIEQRLVRLSEVKHKQFQDFINTCLFPIWKVLKQDVLRTSAKLGFSIDHLLPLDERTLSPSDVGFHNILCEVPSKRLIFIDFEYFGWDDPVKMICDFILQPAMPLPIKLYPIFLKEIQQSFPFRDKLVNRFELLFPILGIKWCLIILNPFLPERIQKLGVDGDLILEQRLAKAQEKLSTVYHYHQTREFLQWV